MVFIFLAQGHKKGYESLYTRLKKIEITQLEKVRFIKVSELKLTQVELLSFFHFMSVAANASQLFCMTHLSNIERFSYHSKLSF